MYTGCCRRLPSVSLRVLVAKAEVGTSSESYIPEHRQKCMAKAVLFRDLFLGGTSSENLVF